MSTNELARLRGHKNYIIFLPNTGGDIYFVANNYLEQTDRFHEWSIVGV